jgi:hypothetical protein
LLSIALSLETESKREKVRIIALKTPLTWLKINKKIISKTPHELFNLNIKIK